MIVAEPWATRFIRTDERLLCVLIKSIGLLNRYLSDVNTLNWLILDILPYLIYIQLVTAVHNLITAISVFLRKL